MFRLVSTPDTIQEKTGLSVQIARYFKFTLTRTEKDNPWTAKILKINTLAFPRTPNYISPAYSPRELRPMHLIIIRQSTA
jgi:hypothetical protein